MQLRQRLQIILQTSGSSAGRMIPALCTMCVTCEAARDIGGGRSVAFAIDQVNLDRMQTRMRLVGFTAGERDHLVAAPPASAGNPAPMPLDRQ